MRRPRAPRTFVLPERVRDAHLRLRFDAVFYAARVWLNGRELGRHRRHRQRLVRSAVVAPEVRPPGRHRRDRPADGLLGYELDHTSGLTESSSRTSPIVSPAK
jgi:hypothetical protein